MSKYMPGPAPASSGRSGPHAPASSGPAGQPGPAPAQEIKKEEKKVEYLELIYDLIFVFVLGRNNSLLHNVTDGFVQGPVFIAYILGSLVAIQIWMFSTYYINMFGRNKARDHVFLFTNMFLLYYIAEGTRLHWEGYITPYYIAWALILATIGVQYLIESRNHGEKPGIRQQAKRLALVLFGEALIVLLELLWYEQAGAWIAGGAILFGVIGTRFTASAEKARMVDFPHLTERAMLYVVFTFGEMIIAIAAYFEEGFSLNSLYFSLMAFLIVVGLFLSYEVLYNRIIERELETSGMNYMIIHIFLIFALNDITTSLEFMHDPEVSLIPKMAFLILSLVLCYGCLMALGRYGAIHKRIKASFIIRMAAFGAAFVALMVIFRENMYVNIALTVAYVFLIFIMLWRFAGHLDWHKKSRQEAAPYESFRQEAAREDGGLSEESDVSGEADMSDCADHSVNSGVE